MRCFLPIFSFFVVTALLVIPPTAADTLGNKKSQGDKQGLEVVSRWPTLLRRSAVTDALVRVGTGQRSEEEIRLWLHCLLQCRIEILKPVWVTKTIGISLLLCQQTDCSIWASLLPPARADWLSGELEYVQGLACGRISADFHKHSQRYTLNKEHLLWHPSLCSKAHCNLSRRIVRCFFK